MISRLKNLVRKATSMFRSEGPEILSLVAAVGLAINFVSQMILSRIYPPEMFGVLSVWVSLASLILPAAMFRLETAILVPKSDEEASALLRLCVSLAVCVSIIQGLIFLVFRVQVVGMLGKEIGNYLYLVPLYLLITAINLAGVQSWVRRGEYRQYAYSLAAQTLASVALKFILIPQRGFFNPLVISELGGCLAQLLVLLTLNKDFRTGILSPLTPGEGWALLKEYRQYPRDGLPSAWLDGLRRELPIVVLTPQFGEAAVGHYARAIQLVRIPMSVLGKPESARLMSEGSRAFREGGDCRPVLKEAVRKLATQGIVVYGMLAVAMPFLVPLLFGPKWAEAGRLGPIVSIYALFAFVGSPVSQVFYFTRKTTIDLFWGVITLGLTFFGLWAGAKVAGFQGALMGWAIAYSLMYVLLVQIGWRVARSETSNVHQEANEATD